MFELLAIPGLRFTVRLFGGKRGLLESAANICANPQPSGARLVGQNNKGLVFHPALVGECNGGRKKG